MPYLDGGWCCLLPAAIQLRHFINEAFRLQQQLNIRSKWENERELCARRRKLKCNEKLQRWLYLIKAQGLNTFDSSSLTCMLSPESIQCWFAWRVCGIQGRSMTASAKCIKIFSAFDSTNDEIICAEITKEMKDRTYSALSSVLHCVCDLAHSHCHSHKHAFAATA